MSEEFKVPKEDQAKVLEAIEGVRKHMSSNHDELREDNKAIRMKLRWLVAWADRLFRMRE